jgi:chemotaxis protein CheX
MVDEVCLNDALLSSAKEVFETMIFMDLEESYEPIQNLGDDIFLGTITFKGNLEGCLSIRCNSLCARTIAQNMLGMNPNEDLNEADISDAIGEVVNMVMGSVKSRIQNQLGSLDVSIPIVVSGRELDNSLSDGASRVSMTVNLFDEYTAQFSILYRETIA